MKSQTQTQTLIQCYHMLTKKLVLRILQAPEKGFLPHVVWQGWRLSCNSNTAMNLCLCNVSRCTSKGFQTWNPQKKSITHLWCSLWCLWSGKRKPASQFQLGFGALWHTSLLWGPLHTRAKSRDHEIVRTQKGSVQKPSQDTSKIMYCGHGPSSKCYFHEFLFTWGSHTF